ncbi:hypothetical protein HXX01_05300, partial [Candidatus Nomurabacteria bacterium]|nr:hypothetical protein [Candidatus Nomurabacteria bacterium]
STSFVLLNDECSNKVIAPSGTCTIDIGFIPVIPGAKTAFLDIMSDDSSSNGLKVTIAAVAIVDSFKRTLTLNFLGTGLGRLVCPEEKISCNSYYQKQFYDGTDLTLSAIAEDFSVFYGWNGDCFGTSDCNLVMGSDKSIIASFNRDIDHSVKVEGIVQNFYPTIAGAYATAVTGDTIKAWGIDFTESLKFDKGTSLIIKGGYDPGYATNNHMTILHGTLTITNGSVKLSNIILK